ncbi:MAG: TldD/PmbA family protein [Candidatus Nanohaloarchaeota archaeon QJJ-5]|nr:TldD/PmbA family protein [Candidatus Nanohaloarchaeota archaeon QJJ-5]
MRDTLESAIDQMQQAGADYADIRYERFTTSKAEIKDQKVEELSRGEDRGVGVRALYDGAWGFSATTDIDELDTAAEQAVRSAKALHKYGSVDAFDLDTASRVETTLDQRAEMTPGMMRDEQRLAILEDAERAMRFHSDTIKSARVVYTDAEGQYMFVNSDGSFIERQPTHYALYCYATARKNDRVETYSERSASATGLEQFHEDDPVNMGKKAAEMAEKIVDAPRAPQGKMPVVIGDKLGGLFAHEAVGHAAEADQVLADDSIFAGRKGETIASEHVSVIDDPTLSGKHGSYRYDDEGQQARKTMILKNGVLNGFLHSRETATRMGAEPTGNGRAEAFSTRPVVRMSNTFFDTGDSSKQEMIEEIDDGLYLKGFKGGQVATAEGNFTFGTTHAYRIIDGEVADIVRGPSISGSTLHVLEEIDLVGDDLEIGDPGYCGKNGQTVYVDTGSPHMRVREMVVG